MMIKIDARSEVVGTLEGNVYKTKRNKSKHYFRKFKGWGISLEILSKYGIDFIVVESDIGTFRTNITTLKQKGISFDNYGDAQKVLPLSDWTKL